VGRHAEVRLQERDLAADADGGATMNLPLQPSVQLDRQLEVSTRSNPLWFKNISIKELPD
jgi:hypothetical protein